MLPLIRELLSALSDSELDVVAQMLTEIRETRALLLNLPEAAPGVVAERHRRGRTFFQQEYICCGKSQCRCATGALHGPYWYSYTYRYKGESYTHTSRGKTITRVARKTGMVRHYHGRSRPAAIQELEPFAGAASVSNILVAQAERLEVAFRQALTQEDWALARQIAERAHAPADWVRQVDQAEATAHSGQRQQSQVDGDSTEPVAPTPIMRWLTNHTPGLDLCRELLSVMEGLPERGRISRQRRAQVVALLHNALDVRLELLRTTAALRAILTAHPEDTVPSVEVVQLAVDEACTQPGDEVQQALITRLVQLEQQPKALRDAELAQLKDLMYDVARGVVRIQTDWRIFRYSLHQKNIDPTRWVGVAPIPAGVDGTTTTSSPITTTERQAGEVG